ncbi:hypothetical protein DL96DRAFT_1463828 [Flagelloscypha sp. PMI_526]|nr:hypothetical protein DL96DRAFT_1463828 [Flagelloscypha sp. PMI_526]
MRSGTVWKAREKARRAHERWTRPGKRKVGIWESFKNIATSSYLNFFLIFLPCSWAAHFSNAASHEKYVRYWVTFFFSFLAIIPLEKLAEWGGEQMSFYVGPNIGDLIIVTMHNAVEATLGLILLSKCELRLLQATIIGVVLLRLLLVPGAAFIVGGVRVRHQEIKSKYLELGQTLLVIGVMALLLPVAFSAALRTTQITDASGQIADVLTDAQRNQLLQNSRGLAVILLTIYIASRIFMHRPPVDASGKDEEKVIRRATVRQQRLKEEKRHARKSTIIHEEEEEEEEPEINPWVCIILLLVVLGLLAVTAEWLVYSIDFVRKEGHIGQEVFGLIIIPIVSFSADAAVTIGYFMRSTISHLVGSKPQAPDMLASARGIDLSVQFTLFWIPFIVLVGWFTGKPMTLYFDTFEVASIIAACFIVNHITADNKTNWAEGYAMVGFYMIIALFAFNYPGQTQLQLVDVCGSVEEAMKKIAEGVLFGEVGEYEEKGAE